MRNTGDTMKVKILYEAGFPYAMRGLARSYNQNSTSMPEVAMKLSNKDKGHNKYLEFMKVWVDIEAPRFWWSEFDTYRVSVSKQSDSTVHTLMRQPLTQENFEYPIWDKYLEHLNELIRIKAPIAKVKNALPDGFIQWRTVVFDYKAIRHIIMQRFDHKLPQWQVFCNAMKDLVHYDYLGITS